MFTFRKKLGPLTITKRAGKPVTYKVKVGPVVYTPKKKGK